MSSNATIPEINLPSCPDGPPVRMAEASVQDAINFSDPNPLMEQHILSRFLECVTQEPEGADPRKWTEQDRIFLLFWYMIHVYPGHSEPYRYECECGKEHTGDLPLMDFAKDYKSAVKAGYPLEFHDRRLVVLPLNGADMEAIEDMRVDLLSGAPEGSPEYQQEQNRIQIERIWRSFRFGAAEKDTAGKDRRREWVESLPLRRFEKLRGEIDRITSEDLGHGLEIYRDPDGERSRLVHEMPCPDRKEVSTLVGFPFRLFDFIPGI